MRITVFDEIALRWPECIHVCVDGLDEGIDLPIDEAVLVTPERQDAARLQYPPGLGEERIDVEPVQRLGDRDEVDGRGSQAGVLGARDQKFDVARAAGGRDLLLARVGCNDPIEVAGDRSGCLAVAGCTVPGQRPLPAAAGQEIEECVRVARPRRRIAGGMTGEVILEVAQRWQSGLRPSACAWL